MRRYIPQIIIGDESENENGSAYCHDKCPWLGNAYCRLFASELHGRRPWRCEGCVNTVNKMENDKV